jgi:hypothetical protein
MKSISVFLFFISFAWLIQGHSQLPKSINIVSGIPLTIPEKDLAQMGLTAKDNTGGWGDVMSNVSMALELKRQFPEINVRLIVTLNDSDTRANVNKVGTFIPNIMKNEKNEVYLKPDFAGQQLYRGVEIYFIQLPPRSSAKAEENLTDAQRATIAEATKMIPPADLGLQFSANDSPISNAILKAEQMHLYFQEYSEQKNSLQYTFLQGPIPQIKLNSGPLGFGVYDFNSVDPQKKSKDNRTRLQKFFAEKNVAVPAAFDMAFAYAGDTDMIDDYVKAVESIASGSGKPKTIIVYKGSGEVSISNNIIKIPLGNHPKELAYALISESTYSPLVTGDGSLSSALETTKPKKSFLYERINWKYSFMATLIQEIFKGANPTRLAEALGLMIPQTADLVNTGVPRAERITSIKSALTNQAVHTTVHQYFSTRAKSLNIADNTVNAFQFNRIFQTLSAGWKKDFMFSEKYLNWLIESTKSFQVNEGPPFKKWTAELDDQVYGKSFQLSEKWFALFSLFEMEQTVDSSMIIKVINETASFLEQSQTEANMETTSTLLQVLDQMNSSAKSKQALAQALKPDAKALEAFGKITSKYNNDRSEAQAFSLEK